MPDNDIQPGFRFEDAELALSLEEFTRRYIEPWARAAQRAQDEYILRLLSDAR